MSLQSLIILSYSVCVRRVVFLRRSNQYSVSAHSLRDICVLKINSFRLTEYLASVRFAPIEVPDFNNCLASTYSLLSSLRYLYSLYILMENSRLFSSAFVIQDKYTKNPASRQGNDNK